MAQREIIRQLAIRQNDLGEEFNDVLLMVQQALITRRRTIDLLRRYAIRADNIYKVCASSNRDANISGAFGGLLGTVGGGIVILSGGLAAPIIVGSLTGFGAAFSIGGGVWSVKNEYDKGQLFIALQTEILEQLAQDDLAIAEMNNIIRRIQEGDFGEPRKVFRELHIFLAGLGVIGMTIGSEAAIDILSIALPAVAYFLSGNASSILFGLVRYLPIVATKGALQGMDEVAEQSAASAVNLMHNGLSKDFVRREALKAAQKAYKEIFEEIVEEASAQAAQKVAKEGGNQAAQHAARQTAKEGASKIAKETATKAAKEAAKKSAQEGAKTAARVTGSVTLAFGVLTSAWEGYNAYKNHKASQEESQLGRELRELARNLENSLEQIPVYQPI